jgi:hypothetical protein
MTFFKNIQAGQKPYLVITLALLAVLVCFQLYKAFHTPLYFDDAYFGNMAKNLAFGRGYSAVYFRQLFPFHWNASSGPVVILPAALMIALFGNTYWVTQLTGVLIILTLLVTTFIYLRRIAPVTYWQGAALFLFSALLLSNQYMGTPQRMLIWHVLQGEVPSALLVILTALVIARHRDNASVIFAAGLIGGLATLCKLLALIGSGTIGLYLAITYLTEKGEARIPPRRAVWHLCLYGAGILLPNLLFELVKLASLGMHEYWITLRGLLGWIRDWNGPKRGNIWFFGKLYILGQFLGVFPQTLEAPGHARLFMLAVVITAMAATIHHGFQRFKGRLMTVSPLYWAGMALLCAASLQVLWYLFISSATMQRYLSQAVLYGCAGGALLICRISEKNPARGNAIFIGLALLLLCARSDAVSYFWTGAHGDIILTEERDVQRRLIALRHEEPDTLIFSCGNSLEMEYLLPESGNFHLCDAMGNPEFSGHKRVLLTYTWIDNSGKPLYALPWSGAILGRFVPDEIKTLCPHNDIYDGTHYSIASCISR